MYVRIRRAAILRVFFPSSRLSLSLLEYQKIVICYSKHGRTPDDFDISSGGPGMVRRNRSVKVQGLPWPSYNSSSTVRGVVCAFALRFASFFDGEERGSQRSKVMSLIHRESSDGNPWREIWT